MGKVNLSRRVDKCGVVLVVAAAVIITTVVSACGKKGPLLPPDSRPRPTPIDLRVEADGDQVTLRWLSANSTAVVAGYDIFRASYPLSGPSCPVCHQKFHKIERLASRSEDKADTGELTFSQHVAMGFRYTYKVRPYDRNGASGGDSNAAGVDVP